MILETNIESGNTTDFIVPTINGRVPGLFKASNGRIEKDIQNAWIGDKDKEGFEVYQKAFHTLEEMQLEEKMRN